MFPTHKLFLTLLFMPPIAVYCFVLLFVIYISGYSTYLFSTYSFDIITLHIFSFLSSRPQQSKPIGFPQGSTLAPLSHMMDQAYNRQSNLVSASVLYFFVPTTDEMVKLPNCQDHGGFRKRVCYELLSCTYLM